MGSGPESRDVASLRGEGWGDSVRGRVFASVVSVSASRSAAAPGGFTLEPYSYAQARELADALELAEPVAVALVRRGYRTVEEAGAFLAADESHDPFEFEGMEEAVALVGSAIERGLRVTVHGDYDVDGVCSTAILVRALRDLGAECDWYIPSRLEDGYGLTTASVERLLERGTGLLITTDCGIGCAEEIEAAKAAGMEALVTDHHQPPEALPQCPVLHPVVSEYPCPELCATGVAHKLAAALLGTDVAERDLDLVAMATVADLVPLRGENRALVRRGLDALRQARRPGVRALLDAASVVPERLDEGDLAFRLSPRINAAGRLYRADAGVELMLTEDADRAGEIAVELDRANRERRETEQEVLRAAEETLKEQQPGHREDPALVLAGRGWHAGVVGIVASKLAERHFKPVVLIGLEGEAGRGSGRSVPGFDLLAALRACERHLVRCGGHRAAAGLEIEAGAVDVFREAFLAHTAEAFGTEPPTPSEAVDAVVGGESLGLDVAEQLARLGPFGNGNPEIRLLVPAARVSDVRPMGAEERHARFSLASGPRRAAGVAFGVNGDLERAAAGPVDVSVSLEVNHWNGAVEPRVVLGSVFTTADADAAAGTDPAADEAEWLARFAAEVERPLDSWPPPAGDSPTLRRAVVDRRRESGVAAVAALASSGEPVLAVCADARRRRALGEHAVAPKRFGGGELALAPGAGSDAQARAALERVLSAGSGLAIADWARLERDPNLIAGFRHLVVIDPAPFAHLDRLADRSGGEERGFLHLAWGDPEVEMAVWVHRGEWPSQQPLRGFYSEVVAAAGTETRGAGVRGALGGEGAHPRSPEVAGRCARVLAEAGAIELDLPSAAGADLLAAALRVVSSDQVDLERSAAYVAYRRRLEEGETYLRKRRAPS
jgi:single-stranded-DNA-specific exonuclease